MVLIKKETLPYSITMGVQFRTANCGIERFVTLDRGGGTGRFRLAVG